jgi:pimeloyl-ACP methyl ester carboxylesterase
MRLSSFDVHGFPMGPLGRALLLLGLSATTACLFPAPTPMRSVTYALPREKARCLVLFLPGAGDSAEEFEKNGFVAELRRRPLSVDMVAANATMGYYFKGLMVERVSADVMEPALARGYEQVWVIGASMGGLGTFMLAHERPAQVHGVLALAPYLGDRALTDEIRAAGGLEKWKAPERAPALIEATYQREIWRWLRAVALGQEKGPDIYLGWGTSDKLGKDDVLLGAVLPKDHVSTVEGGHDWPQWRAVLQRFLDGSDFSRACARQAPPG